MNFKDKVIIISGSGSGIGRSCAELLLEKEAYVIGLDITNSSISNDRYEHHIVDIRDEDSINSLIEQIKAKPDRIDGLINCVGIFSCSKPFYEITLEEWNNVLATNLTGTFLLSKHVAREMIRNKSGKIINISCIRAKIFRPNMSDYAASKGGVTALTATMALDLAKYNIRVNAIAPGFTYTGMTAEEFDNQEIKESSESIIPLGRIAMPEDIAKVALFLLSDMADYMSGETIFVDGGFGVFK